MGPSQSPVAPLEAGASDTRPSTLECYAMVVQMRLDGRVVPDEGSPRPGVAHFLGPGETMARADPPARISLTGELDPSAAAAVAIELMARDGHSDEEVQLLIRSGDRTVAAALLVMDTIDAMGVPVLGIAPGEVGGPR